MRWATNVAQIRQMWAYTFQMEKSEGKKPFESVRCKLENIKEVGRECVDLCGKVQWRNLVNTAMDIQVPK